MTFGALFYCENPIGSVREHIKDDHLPILRVNEDSNYQSGFKIHIHDPIEPNFIKVRIKVLISG